VAMADFWNLGNTTVRNPERIPGALRVFDKYYDGGESFKKNEKQQGEFFEKLLNHKNDGTKLDKLDPTEIPIYNSLEKKLSMNQDTYNQKNGRMYLSAMNDFGIISAYDSTALVTLPGKSYLAHSELQGDIWLRQMLKFQIPNHEKKIKDICIRPAYVILKLMVDLNGLTKFELGLVNLTKSEDLTNIKNIICDYRNSRPKAEKTGTVKKLKEKYVLKQISEYFLNEINERKTKLKKIVSQVQQGKQILEFSSLLDEVVGLGKGPNTPKAKLVKKEISELLNNNDYDLEKFTKILQDYFMSVKSNTIWSDYVDLNPRYLKMCGMLGWSNREVKGESRFIILEEYEELIKSAVNNIREKPMITDDKSIEQYKKYFYDVNQPVLEIDDPKKLSNEIEKLKQKLSKLKKDFSIKYEKSSFVSPERLMYNQLFQIHEKEKEVAFIKNLDVKEIEKELKALSTDYKKITPTQVESLIWKSVESLGGTIKHPSETRNFHVDSHYESIFTAAGDMPDMQFHYDSFDEIVEVTKSEGKTQWRMEDEPVPRHVATHKFYNKKETSCLFLAPSINQETQERFFMHSKEQLPVHFKDEEISINVVPISFSQFKKIYSNCISKNNITEVWLETLDELHCLISDSANLQEWDEKINTCIKNLK
jgi:hypothetical protein